MRALVQEPMNTRSIFTSVSGVPADRPMYSRARAADFCSVSSPRTAGLGTFAVTGATWPGLVPQVTCGEISAALNTSDLSYFAPASVGNARQRATAASYAAPCGAYGRPRR